MSAIEERRRRYPGEPWNPDPGDTTKKWRERITQAEEARKPFEPTWISNLAFVAGKHWTTWDRASRTLRDLQEVDPNYQGRELYIADVITEYRTTALGELATGEDRPQLLLPGSAHESEGQEELAQQINRAVAHGWDHEWDADRALASARMRCVDMGVSAIRCRFDPNAGPLHEDEEGNPLQVPHIGGVPVLDDRLEALDAYNDGTLELRHLHEGLIRWEVGSALNLLPPPGIPHEQDFPWEIWVRPVLLDDVKDAYGDKAAELKEDTDIGSMIGSLARQTDISKAIQTGERSRLRDHVWLYSCYERPCAKYPRGMTAILAGGQKLLMEELDQLPYRGPDRVYRSGIVYFHWWRLSDRFWSRSLIEALKDPQRIINRRRTQNVEIIDRGMPRIFLDEGANPEGMRGAPMEFVKLKQGTNQPSFFPGAGPGQWMYQDIADLREDLTHASTLSPLRLGENPENVTNYSQLALLNENESTKREVVLSDQRQAIKRLVENAVHDIRVHWPPEKQILIAGDGGKIQAEIFNKSRIPDFYVVSVAEGAGKPRSQGAELKKVEAIWDASIASGVSVHNEAWVRWFSESLDAGESQELPPALSDDQTDKAELENSLLLRGEEVQVAYYDRTDIHIPIHRRVQDEAMMMGDLELYQRVEAHNQSHLAAAAENAAHVQEMQAQQMAAQMNQPNVAPAGLEAGPPAGTAPLPTEAPMPAEAPPVEPSLGPNMPPEAAPVGPPGGIA